MQPGIVHMPEQLAVTHNLLMLDWVGLIEYLVKGAAIPVMLKIVGIYAHQDDWQVYWQLRRKPYCILISARHVLNREWPAPFSFDEDFLDFSHQPVSTELLISQYLLKHTAIDL